MDALTTFFTVAGGALVTGFFGIVLWWLQKADADRKENRRQSDERMERIEQNTILLQKHEKTMATLTEVATALKEASDSNGEGVKIIMRYMLQRYHAEYMLQGWVSSAQKRDFLEAYTVYHAKGGNGTAEGWKREVCTLPVRDDLPVANAYLELLRETKK